jgi:hypothetical protein
VVSEWHAIDADLHCFSLALLFVCLAAMTSIAPEHDDARIEPSTTIPEFDDVVTQEAHALPRVGAIVAWVLAAAPTLLDDLAHQRLPIGADVERQDVLCRSHESRTPRKGIAG